VASNASTRSTSFRVKNGRIGEAWGIEATRSRDRQRGVSGYLAGALLIGLAGNAIAGAWWLDPAVGLLIAGVAVKEGLEVWRGEGCCVSSPLEGVGFADDACQDECCEPAAQRLS